MSCSCCSCCYILEDLRNDLEKTYTHIAETVTAARVSVRYICSWWDILHTIYSYIYLCVCVCVSAAICTYCFFAWPVNCAMVQGLPQKVRPNEACSRALGSGTANYNKWQYMYVCMCNNFMQNILGRIRNYWKFMIVCKLNC